MFSALLIQWIAHKHCPWPSWNFHCCGEVCIKQIKAQENIKLGTVMNGVKEKLSWCENYSWWVPGTVHSTLCMFTLSVLVTLSRRDQPSFLMYRWGTESWVTFSKSQLTNCKACIWTWAVCSDSFVSSSVSLPVCFEYCFFWEICSKEIKRPFEPVIPLRILPS